jgi:MFS family permease
LSPAGAGVPVEASPGPRWRAVLGSVAAILLCSFAFQFAQGLLSPVTTVQLVGHHTATGLIGIVSSIYFVGFIAGTLHSQRVIDRVGHIRALGVFAVLAADATLMFTLFDPPWTWMLWRAALGYALAGIFVVVESWLNDKATAATRGTVFGLYQVVGWGTGVVAPLAMNLADPLGPALMVVAAIAFATALVPVALTRVGNPEVGQRSRFGLRRLIALSPLGVATCFASGLINSAFFGLMPVYTHAVGLGTDDLALILAVATIAGTAVAFPVGVLADRVGRRPVLLAGLILAGCASLAALRFDTGGLPIMAAIAFVFTLGAGQAYTLGVAQTNDYVTGRDFVAASGGLLCAWAVGASIGAAVGAQVMALAGADGLFVYELIVLAALGRFTVYRMIRRPGRPVGAGPRGAD